MKFLIYTREVYSMAYAVEADTPQQALDLIAAPDGVKYVLDEVRATPGEILVTDIQQVLVPKEAA